MNKKVFGRKLSRSRPAREALFSSLSRSMILTGKINTTRAKAKAVIPDVEKLVTLSKKGDLSARRRALSMLNNADDAIEALFGRVATAFANRQSGFTRLISLPRRKGDNAQLVRIEWTEAVDNSPQTTADSKTKKEEKTKKTNKKVKKIVEEKAVKKAVDRGL
ncbi:MAG TPA: 50S ribosomal protein L17 [Patescibacteria group bacterium]|nr:50S ribosomal protein L17 [Patescibacteria group bacterium]